MKIFLTEADFHFQKNQSSRIESAVNLNTMKGNPPAEKQEPFSGLPKRKLFIQLNYGRKFGMKNLHSRQFWKNTILILTGNLLVAFAVSFFILPGNILSGGTATLAMALSSFIPVSQVSLINILTISLFLLGWAVLGQRFAMRSLLSSICYPLFISAFSHLDTSAFSHVEPMLSALYAGAIMGAGLGLVFRAGASTGGMDVPALILHRYLHVPLNMSVMIVDTLTILFGMYIYGLNSFLIGLLSIFASSYAINWMSTAGSNAAKNVMIISDRWQEIRDYLLEKEDRGVTIVPATGAWTNQQRPVLMCVVPARRYSQLEDRINEMDPTAFIVVTDVHEVRGRGFNLPVDFDEMDEEKSSS